MSEKEGLKTHSGDQGRWHTAGTIRGNWERQAREVTLTEWTPMLKDMCPHATGNVRGIRISSLCRAKPRSSFIPGQLWKRIKGIFIWNPRKDKWKDYNSNTISVCTSAQFCAKRMQRCGLLSIRKPKSCTGTISESHRGSILGAVALAFHTSLLFTAQLASLQLLLESTGAVYHRSFQKTEQLQILQMASLSRIISNTTNLYT